MVRHIEREAAQQLVDVHAELIQNLLDGGRLPGIDKSCGKALLPLLYESFMAQVDR